MVMWPELPASGVLIHVRGSSETDSYTFESIEELRTCPRSVTPPRIQILIAQAPQRTGGTASPGARVSFSDEDGLTEIVTDEHCQNPYGAALVAHNWAYSK